MPLVEVRARNENGLIPRDGKTMGELEVRGPWIASSYYECPEGETSFTKDGWFRTGDIVAIFPDGRHSIAGSGQGRDQIGWRMDQLGSRSRTP